MKITLLQIDETDDTWVKDGSDKFAKRISRYLKLETKTIKINKSIRQKSIDEQKLFEAKSILNYLLKDDFLILLDENGKSFNSIEFSTYLDDLKLNQRKNLVFLIGGPYGFSEEIYQRSNFQLSLSKMTFSHQMIRVFFLEQLYRACTISRGEKYHHE